MATNNEKMVISKPNGCKKRDGAYFRNKLEKEKLERVNSDAPTHRTHKKSFRAHTYEGGKRVRGGSKKINY